MNLQCYDHFNEFFTISSSDESFSPVMEAAHDIAFVYVTFPDRDTARSIARAMIELKFAACANISSEHESIYRWETEIKCETEIAAIFKTTIQKIEPLSNAIRKKHPYDTPCIIVLKLDQVNSKFAEWIRTETKA